MTGKEFLNVMVSAMPSHAELAGHGLDDKEIESIQRAFKAKPVSPTPNDFNGGSELEKMIRGQDCSAIEVGSIRFLRAPGPHPHGVKVAVDEADPLVVRRDGSVAVYDHADHNFVILECAPDSGRFLDVLSVRVSIQRERSVWQHRFDEAVELCASRSGGTAYLTFCRSLCGFLL